MPSSQCVKRNQTTKPQMQFQNPLSFKIRCTALKRLRQSHLSRSCNNPMFPVSCLAHVSIRVWCPLPYLLFKKNKKKKEISMFVKIRQTKFLQLKEEQHYTTSESKDNKLLKQLYLKFTTGIVHIPQIYRLCFKTLPCCLLVNTRCSVQIRNAPISVQNESLF